MKDGEAAFPRPHSEWKDHVFSAQFGMSLRDWFAGNCHIELDYVEGYIPTDIGKNIGLEEILKKRAQLRYLEADAMLKERNK